MSFMLLSDCMKNCFHDLLPKVHPDVLDVNVGGLADAGAYVGNDGISCVWT